MLDSEIVFLGFSIFIPGFAKQILVAAAIGVLIGLEREFHGKKASLRTFSTITVGSCLFTLLSIKAVAGAGVLPHDVTRVAAQIVSGIGFLGGGVIFKTSDGVEGITTAAMIWCASALGMACGFNQIGIVSWTLLIGIVVFPSCHLLHWVFRYLRLHHLVGQRRID